MSVSREDIKKGMKQDAAAAWAKIKKLAGRWWVYGAVALGVGGSSAPLPEQNASLGASPFEQSLNEGSRRLENKLKISEMKKTCGSRKAICFSSASSCRGTDVCRLEYDSRKFAGNTMGGRKCAAKSG